jgi:beta-galactosidase
MYDKKDVMRVITNFNQNWRFIPEVVAEDTPDDRFEVITLPHSNRLFVEQRFVDNLDYQFISTYRKRFDFADKAKDKRVFLDFDGVMLKATAYLNGHLLGVHAGGYTPFSFDITDYVKPHDNLLTVYVDSNESQDIPPYGGLVDFLTFGGIYRDVYIRSVNDYHITNAFIRPENVLNAPSLVCDITLSAWTNGLTLEATLKNPEGGVLATTRQTLSDQISTLNFDTLSDIAIWTLDAPTLYQLDLKLYKNERLVDDESAHFGFREAEFRQDGAFYLNGERLKLFGLNRHQTYPYLGAAAPARLQRMDADIIKYELGCNIVRTSHYAQSPHFIQRCDEIGLLVFEEIAGWQHIGDEDWQALVFQDLKAMIERDRNHPSIILWGVRVNESPDHEVFYSHTNALAHQLDPTRQTGGVRNFADSQFLEDVFTLNDFTEGIQTPRPPHLITEFGGHMYPTKTWDHESRRVEHALKHARKHNLQFGHDLVAGAIGWCAFDYHTHQDFGSGDRICYHGVMDIYRLPKMAGYFYRSQKPPQTEIVLYPATSWTMGDRDGGGNNPLVVFSNCDSIEVWVGEVLHGRFYPDHQQFPNLAHPPFTVTWAEPYNPWGMPSSDLEVRAFLGDDCVAIRKIASDHKASHLEITSNTDTLIADGADMARIAVRVSLWKCIALSSIDRTMGSHRGCNPHR